MALKVTISIIFMAFEKPASRLGEDYVSAKAFADISFVVFGHAGFSDYACIIPHLFVEVKPLMIPYRLIRFKVPARIQNHLQE